MNAIDKHVPCLSTLVTCVFWSCLGSILSILGIAFFSVFPSSSGLLCLFKLTCSWKPWTQTLPAIESSLIFGHNVTGNTCKFECQRAKFSLWQSSSNVREAVLGTLFHLRELSVVQCLVPKFVILPLYWRVWGVGGGGDNCNTSNHQGFYSVSVFIQNCNPNW